MTNKETRLFYIKKSAYHVVENHFVPCVEEITRISCDAFKVARNIPSKRLDPGTFKDDEIAGRKPSWGKAKYVVGTISSGVGESLEFIEMVTKDDNCSRPIVVFDATMSEEDREEYAARLDPKSTRVASY